MNNVNELLRTGLQWLQRGTAAKAEPFLKSVLRQVPAHPSALHYLGVAKMQLGDYRVAIKYMIQAVEEAPEVPEFHHNLAAAYRAVGNLAAADEHYRSSLELKPDYYEAYYNWAQVHSFADSAAVAFDVAVIDELLATRQLSPQDRSFLHFAAGKIYDDRDRHDDAFAHYRQGNDAMEVNYPADKHQQTLANIRAFFTLDRIRRMQLDVKNLPQLVFIVGFPRSGTTLTEQILASHPDVLGAGELPWVGQIVRHIHELNPTQESAAYPHNLEPLRPDQLASLADMYLDRVATLATSDQQKLVVLDKMPSNYMHLGLIAVLFPQAKVIHCRRHPWDTCLSCYFTRFTVGHEYTYDLPKLAVCYRAYRELMEHWSSILASSMMCSEYAELVAAPEVHVRRLVEFCGLTWHDDCLRFHESERTVETASSCQVRQPIHQRSIDRWQAYQRHLGPLRELASRRMVS